MPSAITIEGNGSNPCKRLAQNSPSEASKVPGVDTEIAQQSRLHAFALCDPSGPLQRRLWATGASVWRPRLKSGRRRVSCRRIDRRTASELEWRFAGDHRDAGKRRYTDAVAKTSAGLVMYRVRNNRLEVLLIHLGGPFWAKKDKGAWFIPKGELSPSEDEFTAAKREFQEETGFEPYGNFIPLGSVKHKGGKTVHAWAFEGDCDPSSIRSNTFTLEWPPRSGHKQAFPEIDRARFLFCRAGESKEPPRRIRIDRTS